MVDALGLAGLAGLAVATLGGACVGVERQRSGHASGARARFGGVRTFTMIGGVAGIAGHLSSIGATAVSALLVASVGGLVIAGYVAASRRDIDATTEVAAMVVIAAGLLAGRGEIALASAVVAITTLLLIEKSRLHTLVAQIDDAELKAAARFGVMAIVILPLLPAGPFGPFGGIRPRALWILVLFFSGVSFAGYLAQRLAGQTRGYPLAGLLGGMVSSTSVTFTYATLSRRQAGLSGALGVGTIAACTMLFPRVLIATAVLNRDVAMALAPLLAAPFAVGVGALLVYWRSDDTSTSAESPRNPLQLMPALQMAAVFQVVLVVTSWVRGAIGDAGLVASAAILGLTDVDALTVSMVTSANAGTAATVAGTAIAMGVLANCVTKITLAITFGAPRFRRVAAITLAGMIVCLAAGLLLRYA
ncbi:MAG: DUF4010 domain-containing protein [Acidobacteriota bacterium]